MSQKFRFPGNSDAFQIQSGQNKEYGSASTFLITGMGGTPEHLRITPQEWMGIKESNPEGPLHINSGSSEFVVKEDGSIKVIGGIYSNGLRTKRFVSEITDDGTVALPSITAGFGTLIAGNVDVYASFKWDSSGIITLLENTSNVVSTDTDNYFCIYNNGGAPTIKNRLGSTLTLICEYSEYDITPATPDVYGEITDYNMEWVDTTYWTPQNGSVTVTKETSFLTGKCLRISVSSSGLYCYQSTGIGGSPDSINYDVYCRSVDGVAYPRLYINGWRFSGTTSTSSQHYTGTANIFGGPPMDVRLYCQNIGAVEFDDVKIW